MTGLTYRATGVDPTRAAMSLAHVRERIARTKRPEVIGDIGGFGGLFASPGADRVLVATTDGVGTKLEIARLLDRHEVVGTDLVHHCVNDAMAMGAEPLFFLDYFSTSRIDPAVFARVVGAMADACAAHGCALLGGETAEMPGMYGPGAYDLAGFLVGAVARDRVLRPDSVRVGDACIGLLSSGLHTNGYTLARRVLERSGLGLDALLPGGGGERVGEALLEAHRWYGRTLAPVLETRGVHALAHVTGGGLAGNLVRVLPDGCRARIDPRAWPRPPLFRWLIEAGDIPEDDARATLNLGIGMAVVCASADAGRLAGTLRAGGETVHVIGDVAAGARGVEWSEAP